MEETAVKDRRILVVGCGFMGRWHARMLRQLGVTQLALCDPAHETRQAVQRDLEITEGYADFTEALKHKFDAVFICTPPALHLTQATLAIEAGCDVFLEKPLADRLDGVEPLIERAETRQRILMVGLCLRFHHGLQRVKQLIEAGAIGRLVSVRAMLGLYLPQSRPNVDYRHVYISQPGGGVTLDYLHEIDFVQWIAGSPVRQVFAFTGKVSDLDMQADDIAEILLRFDNGMMASVHLNLFQRVRQRRSEFIGTEGTIIIDLADLNQCTVQVYRAATATWETEIFSLDRDDLYRDEDRVFLHCLATRESPELDGWAAKTSLTLALAAIESSQQKMIIEL